MFTTGFEALLRTPWLKSLAQRLIGDKAGLNVTTTWYLTDNLGSNVATTDAAGQVLERSHFAPYGERWGKAAEQGPAYTGHYEDPTGLTYMKARYHSGIVGRFISPDPVQVDTSGGNFNRYWYGNNNPQKFVDPDGRESACFSTGVGCGLTPITPEIEEKQAIAMRGLVGIVAGVATVGTVAPIVSAFVNGVRAGVGVSGATQLAAVEATPVVEGLLAEVSTGGYSIAVGTNREMFGQARSYIA